MKLHYPIMLLIVLFISGCSSEIDVQELGDVTANRCVEVSRNVIEDIQEAVEDQVVVLGKLGAVKSNDFESVYFVSFNLQGSDFGDGGRIATFATNREDGSGMYFAINKIAREYSVLPSGGDLNDSMTMADDGAKESQHCIGS